MAEESRHADRWTPSFCATSLPSGGFWAGSSRIATLKHRYSLVRLNEIVTFVSYISCVFFLQRFIALFLLLLFSLVWKWTAREVGVVHNFKYLGLTFDSKQFFIRHTTSTQRKSQQKTMFPSETETISFSTQTSPESVSKHHKAHFYLLRHDLSSISFSLTEEQVLENCKKHNIKNYWPSSSFSFWNHRPRSSPQGTFNLCWLFSPTVRWIRIASICSPF